MTLRQAPTAHPKGAVRSIVVGTRGSRLAMRQTALIVAAIEELDSSIEVEIRRITTSGDRDQRAFAAIEGKGLFTTEVERALVAGTADIAVHSAKDLTADLAPGCVIACVPARASAADVVVGGTGATGADRLSHLPPGSVVGTSSMRRRALLAEARPDLKVADLRGNIDTRLRKVAEGMFDAAILAAAGLQRLDQDSDGAKLDPTWWIPAPGQGTLVVECLGERTDLLDLLAPLTDPAAAAELACERAFASRLEGGCSVPLGCLATAGTDGLSVLGYLGAPDGSHAIRDRISGPASAAVAMGEELADAMLSCGGREILDELRDEEIPAPSEP